MRNIGLGLESVAEVLERQSRTGTVEVLHKHRDWLLQEQERLVRLVRTVESTIKSVKEGSEMEAPQVFEGFEHNPYEAEARERWGDAAVHESRQRLQGLSEADAHKARTGYSRVHEGLAPLLAEGVDVSDERVQELVQLHYEATSLFWTPDREAYQGLGQMYVGDERYGQNIAAGDTALVAYLRDAMTVYADTRLGE